VDHPRRRCAIRLTVRQSRRLLAATVIVVGALVVAGLILRADSDEHVAAASGSLPEPVFAPTQPSPAHAPPAAALGPSFRADAQLRPTGDAGQAKLWFNDGRWWGLLLAEDEFRIHAFDPVAGWTDTGTVIDARTASHADVLAEGPELIVVSAGRNTSAANAVEVRRFSYDPAAKVYRADRQFPVRVSDGGASHVSVARGANGTLWVAFVTEQRLEVSHTLGDVRNWTAPATPPVPEAAQPVDAVGIAASGDQIAVLAATAVGGTFVATTADGGERWTSQELVGGGEANGTRAVTLRSGPPAGPRFVGLTDVPPAPEASGNDLAAHVVLVASNDGARWTTHAVSRVADHLADPTLAIDEAAGTAVVFAVADGSVHRKQAPLDRLVFPSGPGEPVLPSDIGARFQEPTTARTVHAGEGLVVLAADGGSGRYGQAAFDVPDVVGGTGRSTDGTILADAFEGRPAQSGPPPGWQLASDAGSGELSLVEGLDGLGLQVRTAQATTAARACRRFASGRAGSLTTTLAVRYSGGGGGDAVIASLRGAGESVSLRVDSRGRVAWFDGPAKQVGTRTLAPATWYLVEVTVDPGARTFGFVIRDAGGATLADATRVAWRDGEALSPDQLCVTTREGAGAELTVDDVQVRRS
jgi:hypothetical protein